MAFKPIIVSVRSNSLKAVSLGFRTKTNIFTFEFWLFFLFLFFFCQYARFYMCSGVGVCTFSNQSDILCQMFDRCLQRSLTQTLGQKVPTFLKTPRFPQFLLGAPDMCVHSYRRVSCKETSRTSVSKAALEFPDSRILSDSKH